MKGLCSVGMCLAVLALVLVEVCWLSGPANGQIHFSPSWGKRAGGQHQTFEDNKLGSSSSSCEQPSPRALVDIYRLIEMEAERIAACNQERNTRDVESQMSAARSRSNSAAAGSMD